jgi:hypothetical protein
MLRFTGAPCTPPSPDDPPEPLPTRSYRDIARILARAGRPMSVEHVARQCRAAQRTLARALLADMMELLRDATWKSEAIARTGMNRTTGTARDGRAPHESSN